jgi:hypothetical protein
LLVTSAWRQSDAECLGGLEIDCQVKLGWLRSGNVGEGLVAVQELGRYNTKRTVFDLSLA